MKTVKKPGCGCNADNWKSGWCGRPAMAGSSFCEECWKTDQEPAPAPNKILIRINDVDPIWLQEVLGVRVIRRSDERQRELENRNAAEARDQGFDREVSGVNPFRVVENGKVGGTVQNVDSGGIIDELSLIGFVLTDLHILEEEDPKKPGQPMFVLVADFTKGGDGSVWGESMDFVRRLTEGNRAALVCANPMRDGVVTHTVGLRKAQNTPAKWKLKFFGGVWDLEGVPTPEKSLTSTPPPVVGGVTL